MTLLQNDRSNSAIISFIKGTFKRMKKKVSSSQSLHGTTISMGNPLDPELLHALCIFLNKVLHWVSYRLSVCSFGLTEFLDFFLFVSGLIHSNILQKPKKKKKNENSTEKPTPFYYAKQTKKITLCDHLKNNSNLELLLSNLTRLSLPLTAAAGTPSLTVGPPPYCRMREVLT